MSADLPPLSLDDVTQTAANPLATVNTLLADFNAALLGPTKHVPLWLLARDPNGKVQGGLLGQTYWSWCVVNVLAVAEPYRRQGIGSRLLARAEEIARERGCIGIRLDTTSFQAPDFYRRHGYSEFGRIDDYPPDHTHHWFMKRF